MKMMLFKYEYRRQRFIGRNVFVSMLRAAEYALQPLPF